MMTQDATQDAEKLKSGTQNAGRTQNAASGRNTQKTQLLAFTPLHRMLGIEFSWWVYLSLCIDVRIGWFEIDIFLNGFLR